MRQCKQAAPPLIGAIAAALPLLLLALRQIASSFPSFFTSLAALAAALVMLTTTNALPTLPLSAIAHPCASTAPLLSVGRFAFGCQNSSTSDALSFFLAVFFHSTPSGPAGPAVWVANPARPISRNASLFLSSSAHLILSDPNTSPAWSLAFSASSPPASITLDDSGNLVIHDFAYSPLWQSFLHPLDLLLPGQIMTPGTKLVAGSHSPSGIIAYAAVMEPARFSFFTNFSDSPSLPYSIFSLNSSSSVMNDRDYCSGGVDGTGHSAELQFSSDATQLFLRGCVANVSLSRSITFRMDHQTVDFLRLDPDGNMRGYKYDYGNETWSVVYGWFVNNSDISYGMCSLPSICGPYGICNHLSKDAECSCPHLSSTHNSDEQLFLPLNKSDFRQGCRLANSLNCSADEESHYFIELQGADYFANDALTNEHITRSTEQECVASCAENCTCKAAFYRADVSACFHYEQVMSIIGLANSTKFFGSPQIEGNVTKKVSYAAQFSAGRESATLGAQLMQYAAQSNSTQMDNRSSDVLINYVGFLKVKTNAVKGSSGSSSSKAGNKRYLFITIGSTMAGLFLLGVTIGLLCVCCKKRRSFKALRDEEFYTSTLPGHHNLVHFTFAQLQEASGDFKCKLGVGGFGSAYKGTLSNGSIVAIKQLENAIRGDKEFESQVAFLHSLNHPNIVRLSGFCANGSRRLLISEYMSHGSLDAWIFNKPINKLESKTCLSSSSKHDASSLDWKTRFSIALDVAKGLAFLHENNLIHLAVKPQNILLDDKFVAKLSDYGLSRLMDPEEGCLIMHMRGTAGYMAPEWLQHACATEKSDVYSYGMVLMEMLGGRKNVDLSKERESWFFPIIAAKMYKEGKVLEVLDENLTRSTMNGMGEAECEQAKRVMQIAFWCILESPTRRPDMGSLLSMLQGQQEVPEPPLPVSFGGLNVHTSMSNLDDDHHFHHDQSGASSPSCFNISFASEPSSAVVAFDSWSSGGTQLDDCSLLLPSPTSAFFVE